MAVTPKGELRFVPLSDAENARIGKHGTALVDYLLHPPKGTQQELGEGISAELRAQRRDALNLLIAAAFSS